MTTVQILLAIVTGLIVNECCDMSPWLARKLIRWSAHRRYAPPARAELRAEELAAYLDARPGKLFKLITALGFVAAAIVNRKVAPAAAPPEALWQPTALTFISIDKNDEYMDFGWHPNARANRQSWHQLTADVRNAAKEVGVASRSWRRCIKKLQRITGDDRWTIIASNLDLLEFSNFRKTTRIPLIHWTAGNGIYTFRIHAYSLPPTAFPTTLYKDIVETVRAEICRLTSDFLDISSASCHGE